MKKLIILLLFVSNFTLNAYEKYNSIEKAYLAGDSIQLYNQLQKSIASHPEKAESLLYLYDIHSLNDIDSYTKTASITTQYIHALKTMSGSDYQNRLLQAKLLLHQLNLDYCKTKVHPYVEKKYFVGKWKISGTYSKYGAYDFDYTFEPEFSDEYSFTRIKESNRDGTITLENISYPYDKIIYLSSNIKLEKGSKLVINSNCDYKLYINKQLFLENSSRSIYRNKRLIHFNTTGVHTVTLKLRNKKNAYFSCLTTDKNFTPAHYSLNKKVSHTDFSANEIHLSPFKEFQSTASAKSDFYTAWYFSTLDSMETAQYYEASLEKEYDPLVEALYASDMIYLNRKSSLYYNEAWKKLRSLWQKYPEYKAFYYWKARELYSAKKYDSALEVLEEGANSHLSSALLKLSLYKKTNRDSEFLSYYAHLKKRFPHSYRVESSYLDYLYLKNSENYASACNSYITQHYAPNHALNLAKHYFETEQKKKAYSLISNYSLQKSSAYLVQQIEFFNRDKAYKKAHNLLVKNIIFSDNPTKLYYLDLIGYYQGKAPDIHWEKINSLYPWITFPGEYKAFSKTKQFTSNSIYSDNKYSHTLINEFIKGSIPKTTIPYKAHTYKIHPYGYVTKRSEELIYISTDTDLNRYGEYKIPNSSNLSIVTARVYHKDGSFSDSYTHNRVRGSLYITLNRVSKESLVHIVYSNLLSSPFHASTFYESGFVPVCKYNESVGKFDLVVEHPKNEPLSVTTNRKIEIKKTAIKDSEILSFTTALPKIKREQYNGSYTRALFSYSLSTLVSNKDLVSWYRGNFPHENSTLLKKQIEHKDSELLTKNNISAIYYSINRLVKTSSNYSFYPNKASQTLYFGEGSAEDKVFLCRDILRFYGIQSYPALVLDDTMPESTVLSKDHFKGILLYIPKKDVWLDFSNRNLPYGVLSDDNFESKALVIKDIASKVHSTVSKNSSGIHSQIAIHIDQKESRFSLTTWFKGSNATSRDLFTDPLYVEHYLAKLTADFSPTPIISKYSYSDPLNYAEHFTISLQGSLPGYTIRNKDMIIIKPFIEPSSIARYAIEPERKQKLFLESALNSSEQYTITVSDEFLQQSISYNRTYLFKSAKAVFSIQKQSGSNIIKCSKEIKIPKYRIESSDYALFKSFVINVRKSENHRITLIKDTADAN